MHRDRKRLHADRQITLCAVDWCFLKPEIDAPAYYQRLARSGYAAAEMVPPERQAMARAAGLKLLNLAGAGRLNRAEKRELMVAQLREQIAQRAGRTPV